MRNYIMTTTTVTAELAEIRARLALLEQTGKDNAEAVSDLSEDMRQELDNIYEAIAALSVKVPQARKSPQPIGFKKNRSLFCMSSVLCRVCVEIVYRKPKFIHR